MNRLNLNSRKSKPSSTDRYRNSENKPKDGTNKPGGQPGHIGTTQQKADDPDEIKIIKADRSNLPASQYKNVSFERRQEFDIDIRCVVTEYRAQILEDQFGQTSPVRDFHPERNDKAVNPTRLKSGVIIKITL